MQYQCSKYYSILLKGYKVMYTFCAKTQIYCQKRKKATWSKQCQQVFLKVQQEKHRRN